MNKIKNSIYAWACDIESYRGEGILGINFLKHLSIISKKKIYVDSPYTKLIIYKKKIKIINYRKEKQINFNFFYNYFFPFYGIFKLYKNSYSYSNICYVNFLPLWNTFLFLFLPKKTIFGPITGSIFNGKVNNILSLIRKYIIPFFYRISLLILCKKKYLLFSTSILKKFCNSQNKKKVFLYDYNLVNYKKKYYKNIKKNIDFLFYYRKYSAHGSSLQKKIINKLAEENYKIYVIGDVLNHKNIKNLKIIDRSKTYNYLKRTKFTINEATNFFSIFCLDALSCGVQIFYDKKIFRKQNYFLRNYFTKIDFDKTKFSVNKIKKKFNNYKKQEKLKFNPQKFSRSYNKYFSSYFEQNK